MNSKNKRLLILDVLRGFAIISIMLLHNIEHFDVYYFNENLPQWMKTLDSYIWDGLFFMFSGKSYALFAFMFGVTYYIQESRQLERGNDFRLRFVWRMLLLFGFGIFNSAFFQGDILSIYAVLGILMLPLVRLSSKALLAIAAVLMLVPTAWVDLVYGLQHPEIVLGDPESWTYFGKMFEYIGEDSFWDTVYGNLTNGKIGVLKWNAENGRFFLILGLFLLGIVAGRKQLFVENNANRAKHGNIFRVALLIFITLHIVKYVLTGMELPTIIYRPLELLRASWGNTAGMFAWVSGLSMLYYKASFKKYLDPFRIFGKMSLSNYVMQSILGSFVYYGFGLGLYKYTGATYGLLIAGVLTLITGWICYTWGKKHSHGPLEGLWHKATWLKK